MAIPAAPAPFITTFMSSFFFPASFKAFVSAAVITIAVPCWSSWNTGISSASLSFVSTSKQRGAEISSKFIPPKEPEISSMVFIISAGSFVFKHMGNASTSP